MNPRKSDSQASYLIRFMHVGVKAHYYKCILLLDGISNEEGLTLPELQNTVYMPTSNKMFNGF